MKKIDFIKRFKIDWSKLPIDFYPRDDEKWMAIVEMRSRGYSYRVIGETVGVSAQRAFQIYTKAKEYAKKNDDELSEFIKERIK